MSPLRRSAAFAGSSPAERAGLRGANAETGTQGDIITAAGQAL
jgi:hypothetical protein